MLIWIGFNVVFVTVMVVRVVQTLSED